MPASGSLKKWAAGRKAAARLKAAIAPGPNRKNAPNKDGNGRTAPLVPMQPVGEKRGLPLRECKVKKGNSKYCNGNHHHCEARKSGGRRLV